jgi:lipoprotein signal peptidase
MFLLTVACVLIVDKFARFLMVFVNAATTQVTRLLLPVWFTAHYVGNEGV